MDGRYTVRSMPVEGSLLSGFKVFHVLNFGIGCKSLI
jgi:hypothetical protein